MTRPNLIALMIASALLVMLDAPSLAAAPGVSTDRAAAAKKMNEREGVVCKRVRETGSRTTTRVCTTQAQREKRRQRAQDDVERLATQNNTVTDSSF